MLSATAALRALALGDSTASQLLEAHVARIAQHNPRIRALVTLDIERARAAAQAVDALPLAERARRLAGEQPLLGLPISLTSSPPSRLWLAALKNGKEGGSYCG